MRMLLFLVFFYALYLCFLKPNSLFYKKRLEFFYISKALVNKFNHDICNQVYIDGIFYANYYYVQNLVNKYCVNENYSINKLKKDILGDIWIRDVNVYKKYPNKLEIKIVERNPFAIWINNENEHKLIDEYGNIIDVQKDEIKKFKNLFTVVSDRLEVDIFSIFNLLSTYNDISNNLVKIVRVGKRRWNLILKNNILVKLPEEDENFFKIWKKLNDILTLTYYDKNLQIIDLRIKDKIYLKYKNDITSNIK